MKKAQTAISVANQFSVEPFGRYPDDGESNGTRFREEYLCPALEEYEKVTVILDGAEGYGSSFLDESFGGLVRVHGYEEPELRRRITVVSQEDPSLIDEIWDYVKSSETK